ncbi:hypothetical protein D3C80_1692170 [compost metagenome]
MRIKAGNGINGAGRFHFTNRAAVIDNLSLKIGQRNRVIINQPQCSNTGSGEIQQYRRAQTTGANHQHFGTFKPLLADAADFRQQYMSLVAFDLLVSQHFHHGTPARHARY